MAGERIARTAPRETGNAVMQCGKVIGYAVRDEEGRPLLVDERGVPVRKDQAGRRPIPPRYDENGNPEWAIS